MSAAAVPRNAAKGVWARVQDLILPISMIATLLVILAPVPAGLMDVLLTANIAVAVIMLLTTLYVRTPLDFHIFPSLLLVTTLVRLVLNIATTRLILGRAGEVGDLAAGEVVRAFGEFVTGGTGGANNIVVGLIIFAIIVVVQFVVITKGATRISEVAARFTLDGMPGKQMAIDADLNAGNIDQREAQRRRQEVAQQADFFGAMDGASKFVRGDAIAGIIIILINIIGGLCIGVAQYGIGLRQAAALFTTLTVGDGLVTQLPAFLISLAAGLLMTRSSQESNLPRDFLRQLFSRPQALAVAGGFLAVLVFTGLPAVPLLALGAGCAGVAILLSQREKQAKAAVQAKREADVGRRAQPVEDYLAVDPMEIELGVGLLRLADPKRGGDLLERIQRVRQATAAEVGVILPKVRVRDNTRLEPNQFRIKIADLVVEQDAIDDRAIDPSGEIARRLSETARSHADELLGRDSVKYLVDQLRQTSPAAVDELIPGMMKLGEVQQVLQALLREDVPIRQLGSILETLGDFAPRTKNPTLLAEHVRQRLARMISARYRDAEARLRVVTIDPALEERIRDSIEQSDEEFSVRLTPGETQEICRAIGSELEKSAVSEHPPIVLVSPQIRAALKQLVSPHLPQLIVLSYGEITRDTKIVSVGMAGTGTISAAGVVRTTSLAQARRGESPGAPATRTTSSHLSSLASHPSSLAF
jgi:flagellar biosynthesis protein FlhA